MIVLCPDLNRVLLSSPHRIRLFIAQQANIRLDISAKAAGAQDSDKSNTLYIKQ
jgi:hypothetical protein